MLARKFVLSLFVVAALAATCAPAWAEHHEEVQEEAASTEAAQAEMPPELAAMLAMGEPVEQHEFLKKLEGTWLTEGRFWMAPDQPPTVSLGKSVNKMILGGRFLQQEYTSEFMGAPFQGLGLDGYDRSKEKFVGVWMDTMGTTFMLTEGTLEDKGSVRTTWAEVTDPATGKQVKMKMVTSLSGEHQHLLESYNQMPDGKFFKTMEIVYKRQ